MSPPAFLDTNIPIYAAGRPHPLKAPAGRILVHAAEHPAAFVTDAEVLQELLHRYVALRMWDLGRQAFDAFAALMQGRIEPVREDDVVLAAGLADGHRDLAARDLLHVAVMRRIGAERIVSADGGFDELEGVVRLDPSRFDSWVGTLTSDG
ncbi:MAG: type II toxin-antitoxin system VapC family toxin [Dehalococcoidia bacterium]